jgi:hypothetical protein
VNQINNPEAGWENALINFQVYEYQETNQKKYHPIQNLILRLYLKYLSTKPKEERYKYEIKHAKFISKFGIYRLTSGYTKFSRPLPFFKDKILQGYFECPLYFQAIDDIIRSEIQPKYPLLEKNSDMYKQIQSCESICVSIRRGDFLSEYNRPRIYVCSESYYFRGIEVIRVNYPNAKIFVFSDDIPWVKQNMKFDQDAVFESGADPVWEKLRLMIACKHFVISNSTFSWWAQHLASNPNKIVVAPSYWRNDGKPVALYEENWTLIDP